MSTHRSNDRSSLCSFTFAAGRHCRTLECGAITLRALCGKSFSALSTLAYLGQNLRPTLHLAQDEYINAVPPRHPEGTGVEFGKPRE